MNRYETILIISPDLDESQTNEVIEGVKSTIESGGGEILKVDLWGRKKLAYPVKRHNDGYYVLLVFGSEPDSVTQLNNHYQITEPIIKHMVVRFEGELPTPAPERSEQPKEESAEDSPDESPSADVERGNGNEDEAADSGASDDES